MSLALQTAVNELNERFGKFEAMVKEGISAESNSAVQKLQEELTELKAKYHMLNARLSKYKVD